MKKTKVEILKSDLAASLVVFLVAIPLCLGIALASGAPLFSGVIAGIVGGIVVGSLSGSQLGVSGPAAGLAVIVLLAIKDLGSYEAFLVAVVLSGVLQIILGYLKAGIVAYYFPSSVIKGMLSGIGIIIAIKQIPHIFGYSPNAVFDESLSPLAQEVVTTFITPGVLTVSIVSLAILMVWEQEWFKKYKFAKVLPGSLAVVVVGVVLSQLLKNISGFGIDPGQLVQVPVASDFTGFISQFTIPDFSYLAEPKVYLTAITLAIIASIETLLSVEATDRLDPHKRVTPTNLELKAQGVGNVVSGLIGGLPITQVIVRSSANIQSGGETKRSAIFHGFLLLISAIAIPVYLNMIPLASLAAILLVIGYKLAKPALFKEMYAQGLSQFIPFVTTIIGIVFTDLLTGIGIGLSFAIFYILYYNFKTPYRVQLDEDGERQVLRIELSRDVTFLNKASILLALDRIPEHAELTIDGTRSLKIDHDVKEIIEDFKTKAKERDIKLSIIGLQDEGITNVEHELHQQVEKMIENKKRLRSAAA